VLRTVYFHIGSIKTGSTGLQKFAYEKRDALLKKDVDYIQFEPPQLHLPRWANADVLVKPDFDGARIAEAMAASPASRILISEEGLMARPHVWQHPVFKNMRRVVILFLRNSVDLVASWASENSLPYNFRQAEHSSGRGVVSVDEGIGIWSNAYRAMLYGFLNAVGSDPELKVVVRPFPPESPDASLVATFLEALDLDAQSVSELKKLAGGDPVNVGKSRKYCDAAYYLAELAQHYDLAHLYRREMVDAVCDRLQSGDDRRVIETLSKSEMQFVRNRLATPGQILMDNLKAPRMINEMPKAFHAESVPYSGIDLEELRRLFLEYVVTKLPRPRAVAASKPPVAERWQESGPTTLADGIVGNA
jgi:hypothetical protein